jgi:histidinol-phosphate aminotransferase
MKNSNLNTIIRKDIAEMEAYKPVASLWDLSNKYDQEPSEVIKLDAGENQLGFSPKVLKALAGGLFNFYPDPEYKELRQALAKYSGVSADMVMVGSGSDELLDLLFRLILNEGDKVLNCPPTFGMYPVLTKLNKGRLVDVPRKADFSLDITRIKQAIDEQVKIIVVCSPNNPTGTVSRETEIVSLLKTGKLVIVDEAYFEFSGKTVVSLVAKYPNLIVLRTLSKWAGLAGLRLGYGIMDSFFVQQLFKIKPPYNVNLAASIAGVAALQDKQWNKDTIDAIVSERKRLETELNDLPCLTIYPSEANLLFIKVSKGFEMLKRFLENEKIAVRYYDSYKAVRLSIGTPEQNNRVLKVMQKFALVQYDSVIFDMDGVLVNVSQSYRQAIKKTVEYMLEKECGLKAIISSQDIDELKKIPGFNNDWDLSFALIQLVSQGVKQADFGKTASALDITVKQSEKYQQVKDIFQSYYLGKKLFLDIYKEKAPINFDPGLISNEILLLDLTILRSLSEKYKLGVATSRPRFEALFALRNLGISPAIISEQNVIALEDAPREKPFPDPLLAAQKLLKSKSPVYVGDSVNDVLAAQQANMPCIFVGNDSKADFEVQNTNQIKEVLL